MSPASVILTLYILLSYHGPCFHTPQSSSNCSLHIFCLDELVLENPVLLWFLVSSPFIMQRMGVQSFEARGVCIALFAVLGMHINYPVSLGFCFLHIRIFKRLHGTGVLNTFPSPSWWVSKPLFYLCCLCFSGFFFVLFKRFLERRCAFLLTPLFITFGHSLLFPLQRYYPVPVYFIWSFYILLFTAIF